MNIFLSLSQAIGMKNFFVCFILGGGAYVGLEHLWRGRSHVSMFIAGGLAFALLDSIFSKYPLPLVYKCIAGAAIITAIEFIAGFIVNIRMGLGVWDYSQQPLNLYGQICPQFSILWAGLTVPIACLSSLLHRWIL